jgi:adenosine deaminase
MPKQSGLAGTDIVGVPKIDLHRHLLGSARPSTLWELARKYGVDVGRLSLPLFRNLIVHRRPRLDLARYIQPWKLFREVIRSADDVKRIALEAVEDAQRDGVRYAEFRSSLPSMPITDGDAPQTRIPIGEYLMAVQEAFAQCPLVTCRLIASVPRHTFRDASPQMMAAYTDRLIDAAMEFRRLVVGVDLTGIERGSPASLFKTLFAAAHSAGLPATIHAGETEGAAEIWSALNDLNAVRIGHGTSAPNDPTLVQELIRRQVVLEVSPTASWLLGRTRTKSSHPVIDSNVPIPFVICTDNPTLNASTLSNELLLAAETASEDLETFLRSQYYAAKQAAFAFEEPSGT